MLVTAQALANILHPGSLMDALERLRQFGEVRLLRSPWAVGHAGVTADGDVVVGDVILAFTPIARQPI